MLTALLIGSAVVGTVASIYNRATQSKEQRKELNEAKSNLQSSYEFANKQLDEANALRVQQTEAMRDTSLKQNATSIEMQNQIRNVQNAQLIVESSQAEGQAVQAVANSGFRNTGSANNIIRNTQSASGRAIKQFNLQSNLNRYQSFENAVNQYTNAQNQLANYRLEVKQKKESMKYDYDLKMNDVQEDIDYMNSGEYIFGQALGYGADILQGATQIYSAGNGVLWNQPETPVGNSSYKFNPINPKNASNATKQSWLTQKNNINLNLTY